jgi:hypothetical protein
VPFFIVTSNPQVYLILSSGRMGASQTRLAKQDPRTLFSLCSTRSTHSHTTGLMCDNTALAVLVTPCNPIPAGLGLIRHPRYSNFKPHHQPLRSVLNVFPQFETMRESIGWSMPPKGQGKPKLSGKSSMVGCILKPDGHRSRF